MASPQLFKSVSNLSNSSNEMQSGKSLEEIAGLFSDEDDARDENKAVELH